MTIAVTLTEDDLKFYREKGYWIGPKLISDDHVEFLRNAHERVWRGQYDGDGCPLYGAWTPSSDPQGLRKLDNGGWIKD